MPDKTWKQVERRIAKMFGTERTPLSGGNSKITHSDCLHKDYYIEVKHSGRRDSAGRKSFSVRKEWLDEMRENCKKEKKKLAFLVFHFKNEKGNYAVLDLEDLRILLGVNTVAVPEPKRLKTLSEFSNMAERQVGNKEEMHGLRTRSR